MDKYDCPGHSGKCKHCGREEGLPRMVNGQYMEMDRKTGEPKIDCCCKVCANNKAYVEKRYSIPASEKFGYRVPKGDEL